MKKKKLDHNLEKIGFEFKDNGDVKDFNGNMFANHFIEQYDTIYSKDSSFYTYYDGVYHYNTDMEIKNTLMKLFDECAPNMWKPTYERAYFESLKHKVYYDGEMNPYDDYINLKNCMLSISTLETKEHSKEFYSTVQLPFSYDPDAKCDRFIEFANEIFDGDESRVRALQEWIGYLLTHQNKTQRALVLYGAGSNGKGVCSSVIEALIGRQNISYASLSELSNQFVRATLFDKQLVMSSENEIGTLNTQYFKQIVGGDTCITASHKNKKPFEFFPKCKIVMSTNNLPDTRDRSTGYYRRLFILHFSRYFSEKEKDVNLTEKLMEELPGILNWALIGLRRLEKNNYRFSECESAEKLLQEYRTEQNPFLEFISECLCVDDAQAREENRIVYKAFTYWCFKNGHRNFSNISSKKFWREFDNAMIILGHTPPVRKNSGNHRYCYGISLKPGCDSPVGC